jgi:hypothetical protein
MGYIKDLTSSFPLGLRCDDGAGWSAISEVGFLGMLQKS